MVQGWSILCWMNNLFPLSTARTTPNGNKPNLLSLLFTAIFLTQSSDIFRVFSDFVGFTVVSAFPEKTTPYCLSQGDALHPPHGPGLELLELGSTRADFLDAVDRLDARVRALDQVLAKVD